MRSAAAVPHAQHRNSIYQLCVALLVVMLL
jgi:hypothetical protein